MRLLLYRNCQVLSVFSFEPSIGVSSLPCWNLEALRGLWCLRVWKKNKCIRSSNDWPLFPRMLIFTMPSSAVKLWKWGPKYLKEGIRCWESSPATVQSSNPKRENDDGGIIGGVSGGRANGGISATSGSAAGAPAGFRAAGARERLSTEEARWWAFFHGQWLLNNGYG